jgi:hypothetical protein
VEPAISPAPARFSLGKEDLAYSYPPTTLGGWTFLVRHEGRTLVLELEPK